MKKILRIPLLLVALLLSSIPLFAHDFEVDGIYYDINSDSITVSVTYNADETIKYIGDIVIPETIVYNNTTYFVTALKSKSVMPTRFNFKGAFTNCDELTSITIPKSITSIGEQVFKGCSNLKKVTILDANDDLSVGGNSIYTVVSGGVNDGMITKGKGLFADAPIEIIYLGRNLLIDASYTNPPFYNCATLSSITIGENVTSINKNAFNGTQWYNNQPDGVVYISNILYNYKGTMPEGTSIAIKEGTVSISGSAFSSCTGLTSIEIPNSVSTIGDGAFSGCSGLTSIEIPNSVTSIGISAFDNTPWYNNQPDGVVYISNILYNYKGTMPEGTSIAIKEGTVSISGSAFSGCTGLTSVAIPNSVSTIGDGAFSGCDGLTTITSKCNTPPTIQSNSFPNYNTTLYIPYGTLEAYQSAEYWSNFANIVEDSSIDGLKYSKNSDTEVTVIGVTGYINNIIIPSTITINNKTYTVTEIADSAFINCNDLASISIPNTVTTIGACAFSGCSGLTSIEIPNSVTSICYYAFQGCTGLTSVTIGNSVTDIESEAFSGCTGLISVAIPNSVTSIGSEAFSGCTGLTEVNFNAENCTKMGSVLYPVFNSCTNLKTVNIGNNVKYIPSCAFHSCNSLTSVSISNSVTSIGTYAFSGCSGLTSVTIPNSVTSIDNCAFSGCSSLAELIINDGIETLSLGYNLYRSSGGEGLFYDCPLVKLYLGRNITYSTSKYGGYSPFYGLSSLKSVDVGDSVSMGGNLFYKCINLVDEEFKTTQTTATINLSSSSNCPPYVKCSNNIYYNGDIITGLAPTNASNTSVSIGKYYYEYGLELNGNYCYIYKDKEASFKTSDLGLKISATVNATSINAKGSFIKDDATFDNEGINYGSAVSVFDNKNELTLQNLDPLTSYEIYYGLKIKETTYVYTASETFTTSALELTTQEAKPTSTTSVRLLAATNCDATEGTGFEWRRYDAPDELPSSKVSCPVVDGVLVGSLRGVKDDVYYKYRPYYTSSSGKTYYGEWIAFFTGDANVYFEPDVRTYDDIQVINNSATVKGYALEGTDVITAQGFEYWKTGSAITPSSTENRMTVSASGISMSATLANLEYNSTYKYRAYVKTAQGTFYGTEMEFSTGEDPSGIEYIEVDADEFAVILRENPTTGIAWVKIAGAAGEEVQYTLTSMSGAMMATGIVKIDGEWNAIELNCNSGIYLLTINDGLQVKTVRLIVK